MKRLIVFALALVATAPAFAGISVTYSRDPVTGVVQYTQIETPNFVFVPPREPVFTFTHSVARKENGDRVKITTTFRNGEFWSKERAVIHANQAGKHGEGEKGEDRRGR